MSPGVGVGGVMCSGFRSATSAKGLSVYVYIHIYIHKYIYIYIMLHLNVPDPTVHKLSTVNRQLQRYGADAPGSADFPALRSPMRCSHV